MNMTDGAVYIDSPISAAVKQVAPFFKQGVFSNEATPLLMRKRPGTLYGLAAPKVIDGVHLRMINGAASKKLPVRPGGAVFYPFNGQGNLHTVANRGYRHVLVLHGESNKRASARPAARLYDYVCVAGPIAIDRYLKAGIFRREDVDQGRLIMTGDTFVQDLDRCRAVPVDGAHILYAPTWEGYGGELNDYSTISSIAMGALRVALMKTDCKAVVIRPHPYTGLLRPKLIWDLVRLAHELADSCEVKFDLRNANLLVRSTVRTLMVGNPDIVLVNGDEDIALCLSDVSAIESVCLKAGLPNFVLRKNCRTPSRVRRHWDRKSAETPDEVAALLEGYLLNYASIDDELRRDTFAVSHSDFKSLEGSARFARIRKIVAYNKYWVG